MVTMALFSEVGKIPHLRIMGNSLRCHKCDTCGMAGVSDETPQRTVEFSTVERTSPIGELLSKNTFIFWFGTNWFQLLNHGSVDSGVESATPADFG